MISEGHGGDPGRVRVDSIAEILLGALAVASGGLGLWIWQLRRDLAAVRRRAAAAAEDLRAFRSILDSLAQPVWWQRADQSLAYGNPAYVRILGGDPEGGTGMAAAIGRDLAQRTLSTGTEQTESLHLAVDGERRLYGLTTRLLADGVVGTALDQTQLEALQADLARHVAGNTEVLESLSTAIAIYGPDRRLSFANRAFGELWALDSRWLQTEPTIGQVLDALRERRRLPEYADFPEFKRAQVNLFQSLIDTREELLHLPDETTLRMVVTAHPFGGLMFTYEDVTDKLALERSYNTLIEVQGETLKHLHEGVAVFGTDGRLKLFNPAFVRIWGMRLDWLKTGEVTLHETLDYWRSYLGDVADWPALRERMIVEMTGRQTRHNLLSREDGMAIEYSSVPLPDGALLLTFLDVSDRQRIERVLRERNEALENADRLKTEFIANVSYELRTPLNTIMGFAEILADRYFGELSERQLEYARGILESSQRLMSLINDILDLATIEAGYMSLDRSEVDIHALLANVLGLTRERARAQQLSLVLDCPPAIGVVQADQRRIKQAVFNLISNACKFTPPGGSVVVSARREATEVVLSVADTGLGIAPADQARVFERFERGTRMGRFSGAGLGLSLVKSFIELHGGRVDMVSAPGKGTTVSCHLPTAIEARAAGVA